MAAAGIPLKEGTASEKKLAKLRETHEPFVSGLAKRIQVALPPWLPPESALDDWQISAWDELSSHQNMYSYDAKDAFRFNHTIAPASRSLMGGAKREKGNMHEYSFSCVWNRGDWSTRWST